MKLIKSAAKAVLKKSHRRLVRVAKSGPTGVDLEYDFAQLITKPRPVVFDVGANRAQSIEMFQHCLNAPRIYAFEPSSRMREQLEQRKRREGDVWRDVTLHPEALSNEVGERLFTNYRNDFLSSLLPLEDVAENPFRGDIQRVHDVETVQVDTVDRFMQRHGIEHIDMLKIDTQGNDFNVLEGARGALEGRRIDYIFLEMNFVKMYEGQGGATMLIDHLAQFERYFIDMYEVYRPVDSHRMAWASGLFGPV